MSNRIVKRGFEIGAFTRRDLLKVGGILLPTYAIAPALMVGRAQAQTTGGFAYYISTNGSDSNAGTISSPWAITAINSKQSTYAGKSVGIIAGTYDVSALMNSKYHTPVLNINGGSTSSSPTYIAACDASGNYSRGAVTLDAKGASGSYGGGNNNLSSIIGQGFETNVPANKGNWTIDGLVLTGFSLWAVHVGNYDGSGGNLPNVTIQNCTFTGGNATQTNSSVTTGVNLAPLVLYAYTNCLVQNNWFHDNAGATASGVDPDHFVGTYVWGIGGGSTGLIFQYNTLTNSGGIFGKTDEGVIAGTTVQNNYIDMTQKTPSGGQVMAVEGFTNPNATGLTSYFRNNIMVGGNGMVLELQEQPNYDVWADPCYVYNNTWIAGAGGVSGGNAIYRLWEKTAGTKPFVFYNNLFYDNGQSSGVVSPYGYVDSNADGFAVCDYNIYGSFNSFTIRAAGGSTSPNSVAFTAWKSAVGAEAHSSTNGSNPFSNNGSYALAYQVQSGSVAYQTGRVGGTLSGAACNVGAWDGTASQIGCSFAGGASTSTTTPAAPVLTIS